MVLFDFTNSSTSPKREWSVGSPEPASVADVTPSKFMYEIPLIFWANESYITENEDKFTNIKDHLNAPFRTENLMHFLIDVFDSYPPKFEKVLSPFNEQYEAN